MFKILAPAAGGKLCYKGGIAERKVKRIFKRVFRCVFSAVLIVALIAPALLVFPVSASTAIYSYNGIELPAIPGVDMGTEYQKSAIFYSDAAGYLLFVRTAGSLNAGRKTVDGVYQYMFYTYNDGNPFSLSRYILRDGAWVLNDSHIDEIYSLTYFDGITTKENGSFDDYALTVIWTGTRIKYNTSTLMSASSPVFVRDEIPDFGVLQSWLDTDVYTFVENSSASSFTVALDGGSVAATYSYQWYYGSSQGGGFTAIPNETQPSFTPKTSAEYVGTSLYFCRITAVLDGVTKSADSGYLQVTVTEEPPSTTDPPATEPSEPDTPVVPDETTPDYSEKLEDIQGSLDDVNNSIGEVGDKVVDALNPTNPELDQGMSDFQDDMGSINDFENQHFADLEENQSVITDQFNVFQSGSTLLASFDFVSLILQNTFSSLGLYQVIITLPIALGMFLFVCSRVRSVDRPSRNKQASPVSSDKPKSVGS